MLGQFLSFAFCAMEEQKKMNDELKERAIKEYKAALKMPRKKKKKAKKAAIALYNIACWGDEFTFY